MAHSPHAQTHLGMLVIISSHLLGHSNILTRSATAMFSLAWPQQCPHSLGHSNVLTCSATATFSLARPQQPLYLTSPVDDVSVEVNNTSYTYTGTSTGQSQQYSTSQHTQQRHPLEQLLNHSQMQLLMYMLMHLVSIQSPHHMYRSSPHWGGSTVVVWDSNPGIQSSRLHLLAHTLLSHHVAPSLSPPSTLIVTL